MRVIAHTPDGVLLSATHTEINQLAGRDLSHWIAYPKSEWKAPLVGTTFDVDAAFKQIHRNAQRVKDIENIKTNLQGVIAHLELVNPFLQEPPVQASGEDVQTTHEP
jgi:hypothetical protein